MNRASGLMAIAGAAFAACALVPSHVAGAQSPSLLGLSLKVDTHEPYVQAQVLVTVRLERSGGARGLAPTLAAVFPSFKVEDAIVEHLGRRDNHHIVKRDGLTLLVTERHFALFPQSPGRMKIGPVTFQGQVAMRNDTVTSRKARSKTITLNVQPIPEAFTGDVWLPAKSVDVFQGFNPDDAEVVIGRSISRRLRLTVHGASNGGLPNLQIPRRSGLQSQAHAPERQERSSKNGLVASLAQKIAVVPTALGELRIPTIKVPWWNTVSDRQEVARFPGHTLTATEPAHGWGTGSISEPQQKVFGGALSSFVGARHIGPGWFMAAAGALVVAALLAGIVFTSRRRRLRLFWVVPAWWTRWRLRRRAIRACLAEHPEQASRAIRHYAVAMGYASARRGLVPFAAEVYEPLRAELLRLNADLYSSQRQPWRGDALADALRHWKSGPGRSRTGGEEQELPVLHPLATTQRNQRGMSVDGP